MLQTTPHIKRTDIQLNNIRRILVPIPTDHQAIPLLKYASSLAYQLDADLTLLHVCPGGKKSMCLSFVTGNGNGNEEMSWSQLLYQVRTWQMHADSSREYPLPDFFWAEGQIVPEILSYAESKQADLILMGTGGVASHMSKFFGSVAAEVMRTSNIPVWIVPTEVGFQPLRHIAYAAQFEQGELLNIEVAQRLATNLGAELSCIHIDGDQEADPAELDLPDIPMLRFSDTSVEDGLLHVIAQQAVDMLVMATHQFSASDQILSHTRYVMFHSGIPLLVLPCMRSANSSPA